MVGTREVAPDVADWLNQGFGRLRHVFHLHVVVDTALLLCGQRCK